MSTPRYDVYPGTHRPLGQATPFGRAAGPGAVWDEDPIFKKVDGAWREFFGISHLAAAINRAPKTIYKWEEKRLFPRATFILNGGSKNGQRRLYTRRQIEGVVTAATEEGILTGTSRFVGSTQFPAKCHELFRVTRGALPAPIKDWSVYD